MSNTAFEDEGLYLYVGHLEIRHFLHGAALQGDYPSYFSGAPVLYPVLGALADGVGGLAAARALSLLEMLAVTGLIYAMSRRLFNERVGLCAAVALRGRPSRPCSSATWPPTMPPRCSCSRWRPGWWCGWQTLTSRSTCWPRRCWRSRSPPSTRRCCSCRASSAWPRWRPRPRLGRQALVNVGRARRGHRGAAAGGAYLAGPDYLTGVQVHHPRPVRGHRVDRVAALGRRAVDRAAVPARGGRRGRLRGPAVHRAG